MHVQKTTPTATSTVLAITAEQAELDAARSRVLSRLKASVKLPGFRAGKVPLELVEKNLDPQQYQSEFLDDVLNVLYSQAVSDEKIRVVSQPQVEVKKFVPFTTLEFTAEVDSVGAVKLAPLSGIKATKDAVTVTDKDVSDVVDNIRLRTAEKKPVDRASKDKDEVWIDFTGVDAKTKEPIAGADGTDYPLALGSNTFIPGFEEKLVGAEAGETREFTLEFPKDYGVKALQNRKVTFSVTVTKVNEVVLPGLNDAFAKTAGPFDSVAKLQSDIKAQLVDERQYQADRAYESALLEQLTEKSEIAVPDSLIDSELERIEQEERRNVTYRGQTWQEHLDAEGVTEEEHKAKNRPAAAQRVKAGLVLAEIAEDAKLDVTRQELDLRKTTLKAQYQDPQMRDELDKPENERELASRLLSEKSLAVLVEKAGKK